MIHLIRSNTGLLISLGLLAGGAVVCALIGLIMARSGAPLRPIYWFAGFFALIVVPQVIGHLYLALRTSGIEAPHTAALERIVSAARTNAVAPGDDARSLFGPDADPQLIIDVRGAHGDVFATAELAQFAVLPNGDTVLLARFDGSLAAERGWVGYLRVSGLGQLPGQGDSQRGFAVTRPVGDRAYVLHSGRMIGVWTGKDDGAIRRRMAAGGFAIPKRAPLGEVAAGNEAAGSKAPDAERPPSSPLSIALKAVAFAAYACIVVLYFFKGVAWAGTARAQAGTTAVPASELTTRLEGINALDVPFRVERGTQPNEWFATWRYADAKWIDLARARGMRRTFRVRMVLDEAAATVRATDYVASFDASAGRGGAAAEWKVGMGIILFQREHQRVYGLQLDERGRFKPELSYAYTFKPDEMRAPLIDAVTRAGWAWRPTVWVGPTWLRWLTE